jgi:hypothetical protein
VPTAGPSLFVGPEPGSVAKREPNDEERNDRDQQRHCPWGQVTKSGSVFIAVMHESSTARSAVKFRSSVYPFAVNARFQRLPAVPAIHARNKEARGVCSRTSLCFDEAA